MLKKSKVIYLLAASHSGSTLTAMLLGAHPQLSCVGELKVNSLGDPQNYLCSCKQKITHCEFWNSIELRMKNFNEDFSITNSMTDIRSGANNYESALLNPLVRNRLWEFVRDGMLWLSSNWRQNLPKLQIRNYHLIKSILDETDTEIIVDSSKIGIRLKYLLQNPQLDIKVIWLVRDGRGVSLAYQNPSEYADSKVKEMRGGGTGHTPEVPREMKLGAHEWRRCNEEAMNVLATMDKNQWIKVHYEDICEKTEQTLDKIFDFVGVDKDRKQLNYRAGSHHMVGNGMRLDSDITIKVDERWKDNLNEEQLQEFDQIAGNLNHTLGYN